ncbi:MULTISPECIES: DUF3455 domain-containing protein [unclassified Phyllobacterium]|uniref:DUF3455 domain-containing protein n=1 Tax=unclassified Phyllobacterium TaxID=2638441 RepID=UPI0030131A7F
MSYSRSANLKRPDSQDFRLLLSGAKAFGTALLSGYILVLGLAQAFAADKPIAISTDGKTEILRLHAKGVQIYECRSDKSGHMKWQFREPVATLIQNSKTVGRHFAGPTWELDSGSALVGKVIAQAPAATVQDITLLKLKVVQRRGKGELTKATIIQRLNTRGGTMSGFCTNSGALQLKPYSAEYVFLAG